MAFTGKAISSPSNASFEAETYVVSCDRILVSYELMGGRGTSCLGVGLEGGLMSAVTLPERVPALSFAVIQCRTRTLKRTGTEISMS